MCGSRHLLGESLIQENEGAKVAIQRMMTFDTVSWSEEWVRVFSLLGSFIFFPTEQSSCFITVMAQLCWLLACLWIILDTAFAAYGPHLVEELPGQPTVSFKQYAGQVILNGTSKPLFYWFFEANHDDSASLPLVLWLNGGPGCSSIGSGALAELGPFRTNDEGDGLVLNEDAWNKVANLIFLETPYGVGYSYSKNVSLDDLLTDEQTAADNLLFLLQWLSMFPEYSNNEFYMTGESYAGHYLPTLASQILKYNESPNRTLRINLKGFAIGNPWTAEAYDDPGNLKFMYGHLMIPARVFDAAMTNCYTHENLTACADAMDQVYDMTSGIDSYNIYAAKCPPSGIKQGFRKHHRKHSKAYNPCLDSVTPYLNKAAVQKSLNVETRPVMWDTCSPEVNTYYSEVDVIQSLVHMYPEFFKAGLRIWIYSGDVDSVVSTTSTISWLQTLNLTILTPWYAWKHDRQVGGWTEVYEELTFTTVRNSGHMVPFDQPGRSLAVFATFLRGEKLPEYELAF